MKLGRLQQLLKSTRKDFTLDNDKVVIDGKTYFQGIYKDFGCDFLLGGEYDRYADHLKKILICFKEANITCYVIFNGSMTVNMDYRLELHEKIINQVDSLNPEEADNIFSEPAVLKDVNKQVLDDLNIQYMICEHDNLTELIKTAKHYCCPVITKNIEYSLLGISSISPKSMQYDSERKSFSAKIYTPIETRNRIGYPLNKLAIFLVLLDEDYNFLHDLRYLIIRQPIKREKELNGTLVWLKRHSYPEILSDISKNLNKDKYECFLNQCKYVTSLIERDKAKSLGVNYFRNNYHGNGANSWFIEGITTGHIAVPYITLKNYNVFSGSWLCYDKDKKDAMLAALEIAKIIAILMSDYTSKQINFVGRVNSESRMWEIFTSINATDKSSEWKKIDKYWEVIPDYFKYFLNQHLPDLNWNILNGASEDSRILMISLIYYVTKINNDFLVGAYCIILSFVLLGPVSKTTGVLKRSNLCLSYGGDNVHENLPNQENDITEHDSFLAAKVMLDFFYVNHNEMAKIFDRKILHVLAEYQHCLQQFNYLNKFCGEKMKSTIYHKTYNGTFVNKMYFKLIKFDQPLLVIEDMLKCAPSVLNFYKKLVNIFDECCKNIL